MDTKKTKSAKQNRPRRFAEARGYVPRYHSKEAHGYWWIKDAVADRIICMCNRQSDSDEIAVLLNAKAHNDGSQRRRDAETTNATETRTRRSLE